MNEMIRAIRPLVIFDCIFVVLLGPIGNVQMFVLKCPEAYVSVVLRIGFYLSALSLPTVYAYLRNRDEEPQLGELTGLVGILIKIALRLVTCSSWGVVNEVVTCCCTHKFNYMIVPTLKVGECTFTKYQDLRCCL